MKSLLSTYGSIYRTVLKRLGYELGEASIQVSGISINNDGVQSADGTDEELTQLN